MAIVSKFAPLASTLVLSSDSCPVAGFSTNEVNYVVATLGKLAQKADRQGDAVEGVACHSLMYDLTGAAGAWSSAPEGSRARAERHLRVCKALGAAYAHGIAPY